MTSVHVSTANSTVLVTENGTSTVVTVPQTSVITAVVEGPQGPLGPQGPRGDIGVGVPEGGDDGELLVKTASGTEWTSQPTLDALTLDPGGGASSTEIGKITWDSDHVAPVVRHTSGTIGRLGQDQHIYCKNNSADDLIKGRVVMFTGVDEATGRIEIGPLLATGQYPSYVYFGVTAEAIEVGDFGMVCTFGYVEGIDTSIYPEDSVLWACTINPGAMVLENQLQPAPALSIPTAVVVKSDAFDGAIFVRASTGAELRLLHDVYTDTAEDGDVLTWIDNAQRWQSKTPANASAPRSITITYPEVGDSFTLFRASRELTIASVSALVSSGSVTYQIKYAADRTTVGEAATALSTVTSTTTGDTATIQNQPVATNDWVWVEITGVTGSPVEFNLSVAF